MKTTVYCYYNTSPEAMFDQRRQGTPIESQAYIYVRASFAFDREETDAEFYLDKVFRLMNVVDGNEMPTKLHIRSMSVGDAAILTTDDDKKTAQLFICRNVGWEEITDEEQKTRFILANGIGLEGDVFRKNNL